MKEESYSQDLQETYAAMETAASDLFGFAVILLDGNIALAEAELLETLYLGLENNWFMTNSKEKLSHHEFRLEFFSSLWARLKDIAQKNIQGVETPFGHEEMLFYKMDKFTRAALYLRSKKHMNIQEMSFILKAPEQVLRLAIEKGREFLLGKRIEAPDFTEEAF